MAGPSAIEKLRASILGRSLAGWQDKGPARTKFQARYTSKPRVAGSTCGNCIWFVAGPTPESPGACHLVAPDGPPDDGAILASGGCALWNAGPTRILLEDALRGRGVASRGMAPGNVRVRLEELVAKGERAPVPPEVEGHLLLKGQLLGRLGRGAQRQDAPRHFAVEAGPPPPPEPPAPPATRQAAPPQSPPPAPRRTPAPPLPQNVRHDQAQSPAWRV